MPELQKEMILKKEIVEHLPTNGWIVVEVTGYNREAAIELLKDRRTALISAAVPDNINARGGKTIGA